MTTATENPQITAQDIKTDLHRVTRKLGSPPNTPEYTAHGRYSVPTANQRLGSDWKSTLRSASLDPREANLRRLPDEVIREDIINVKETVGYPPRLKDYREHGEFSSRVVFERGEDGWEGTLEWAGLDADACPSTLQVSDYDLILDLHIGALMLGKTPSSSDIMKWGEHASSTYIQRYGSYGEAIQEAGLPSVGTELTEQMIREIIELHGFEITVDEVPLDEGDSAEAEMVEVQ
jgi:hypothetical protein